MNSKQLISEILKCNEINQVNIQVLSNTSFDFSLLIDEHISLYAFDYDDDGVGIGIKFQKKNMSHYWELCDFTKDKINDPHKTLLSLVKQLLNKEKLFTLLNEQLTTTKLAGNSENSFDVYSISDELNL